MKKLKLNKEKIAKLTNQEIAGINGGGTGGNSTNAGFTCCWCTSETDDDPQCPSATCSTQQEPPGTCPIDD